MSKRDDPQAHAETRMHLLDAAGEVFAEKGFRAATTREICRKAGANVAAINYHFGGKEGLYEAVVNHAHRHAAERYPLVKASETAGDPATRFRAFVAWFLSRSLCEGRPAWQAKLLAREMIEPTQALDSLVEKEIRPLTETLESLCRELLGPEATPAQARRVARSVTGQCLYYRHAQPVIARLDQKDHFTPTFIRGLVDHITEFSLGGIARLTERAAEKTASPKKAKRKP